MQVADAATASRAPENTPAMVKKIGKTTYKVHVHFSNTSTETMSDKIKRMDKQQMSLHSYDVVIDVYKRQSLERWILIKFRLMDMSLAWILHLEFWRKMKIILLVC